MRRFLLFMLTVMTPANAFGRDAIQRHSEGLGGYANFWHWDSAGSTAGLSDIVGIRADLSIRTKEDGTFSADLLPGFYAVLAAARAFTPACRKVRTKGDAAVEIEFRMNADPLYTAEVGNHAPPCHTTEKEVAEIRTAGAGTGFRRKHAVVEKRTDTD